MNVLDEIGDPHPVVYTNTLPATQPESIVLAPPETLRVLAQSGDLSSEHTRILSALFIAGARLSATLHWETLLGEVLETTIRLLDVDNVSIMLMDEYTRELFIAAAHDLPTPVIENTRLRMGEGVAGWVAQHHQPLLLIGTVEAQRFPKFFPKPDLVRSAISVPLLTPPSAVQPRTVLGVINASRRIVAEPLNQRDLEIFSALSYQIAAALYNARLYQKLQRRATQLQNLIEISGSLTSSLEIDIVLHSIMERAIEILHSEAGSLLLVDPETNELVFKVALGPAGAKLTDTRLPPGAGIAGAVTREGKPLIVNDAKSDPRHYTKVDANTSLVTHSILCVPLISEGNVIGVLEVLNKLDGTQFNEEDLETLSSFAIQSTIAIKSARLYSDLKRAFTETVRVLTNALEARDAYTAGHSESVTRLAIDTARELGWTRERMEFLEIGALVHDIGKIGVSDVILQKPGRLTDDEYGQMKKHPIVGAHMLEGVSTLRPILPYILYHQERFDGSGYPFGLKGKEIPPEGRLLSVVDAFDAMTSDRPYRRSLSVETAIAEIRRNRGVQFDPDVVDALFRVLERNGIAVLEDSTSGLA